MVRITCYASNNSESSIEFKKGVTATFSKSYAMDDYFLRLREG